MTKDSTEGGRLSNATLPTLRESGRAEAARELPATVPSQR